MNKALFALLLIMSSICFAAPQIETIQLNHRLASDVLPEVQAFLPENATARSFNELIIIKAEKHEIETLRQLIYKLDTPAQRILISVLKTFDTISDRQNAELSGDVVISNKHSAANVRLEGWSTKENKNDEQYFQARGIAGRPILISMGESIPQQEQLLVVYGDGSYAVNNTNYYLDINSGFEAKATILPNNQTVIDILPVFSQQIYKNGLIQNSQLFSTVSGPLDTWIEIGQIHNQKSIEKAGTTRYHSESQKQQTIYIKVEQLN